MGKPSCLFTQSVPSVRNTRAGLLLCRSNVFFIAAVSATGVHGLYSRQLVGGIMLKSFLPVLALIFLIAGCGQSERVVKISGPTMGTWYHISWVASDDDSAELQQQVDERLAEINRIMSTYDPESELSRINQSQHWPLNRTVSADLYEVLQISQQIYRQSGGAFDITVGPLVNLWGFGPDGNISQAPEQQQITQKLAQTGSDVLSLKQGQLSLAEPRYLDLSAVAKGWAVDDIASLVEAHGYHNFLVEIGGEIKLGGSKPGGKPWHIAIERPQLAMQAEPQLIIAPGNRAVATSGDYRNFFEDDGVRYSHTIDSHTGRPVRHNLASVTVIDASSARADAWATALTVAGPEKGMLLAEQQKLAVYMILREEDGFSERTSSQFKRWFPEAAQQTNNQHR